MAGDGGESREFNPFRSVQMLLDLTGKKILVTGIANNRSIAWGIAQQLKAAGAELGITYLQGRDPEGGFTVALGAVGLPVTAFIDSGGALDHVHHGRLDATDLAAAILEHLS